MVACRELMLRPEPGIELPATMLCDARPRGPQPAVLHLDDRRRWLALERHGIMARAAGFIDRGRAGRPVVLTVDLRGWGDTAPACTPYDMAGWSGLDRWMCYVSAALGDHVMAMRVRDAAAALAYLASRPEVDPARVALSGRGLGGVVALCAAFLAERIRAVVTMDMPASFQELLESPRYTWSQDAFLAGALTAFDLPELAGALGCPVLLANPLDAMGDPLPQERAAEVYADARAANPFLEVRAGLAVAEAEQAVIVFLAGL
jgi:pimeloyl-ACP methyl ester carboxylesterase